MSHHEPVARPTLLAVVCAIALLTTNAAPALAAILGTLAPATARPGDWVELTTDAGLIDPNVYDSLAKAGPEPVFLQRADPASPGNSCDTPIGDMTWTGGVGTLRFQVPDVPPGPYWILATIEGACWRFGTRAGVLTLTVLPGGTKGPSPTLVGAVVAIAAGAIVGALIIRRRRRECD